MPSRKLSNSELLARRLRPCIFDDKWPTGLQDEIVSILVSAIAQLPPSSTRYLRNQYVDLFCPFCGALHPLSSCTHPDVVEYRLDPVSWMQAHIPAGLQQHLAHVEVKPKRVRIARKQSKTMVVNPSTPEAQAWLNRDEVSQGFTKLKEDIAKVKGDEGV